MFTRGSHTCPVFCNLTSLVLGDRCMAADFYLLLCFLQRAPKLKDLCLKLNMVSSICMSNCEYRYTKISEPCINCLTPLLTLQFDHEASEHQTGSAPVPLRVAPSGSYPRIERVKIYCREDDRRVGPLVQALLPAVIPDGKNTIKV